MASKIVQERVEQVKKICAPLFGKEVCISFDSHTFTSVLTGVSSRGVTGFTLAPEKRMGEDGKLKSPTLIQLTFVDNNTLVFVDEDTSWYAIMGGVSIEVGNTVVRITLK